MGSKLVNKLYFRCGFAFVGSMMIGIEPVEKVIGGNVNGPKQKVCVNHIIKILNPENEIYKF